MRKPTRSYLERKVEIMQRIIDAIAERDGPVRKRCNGNVSEQNDRYYAKKKLMLQCLIEGGDET